MKRFVIVVSMLGAGCSAADMAKSGGPEAPCSPYGNTRLLDLSPNTVQRNDPITLTVRWQVVEPLGEPVLATLVVGVNEEIDVAVPLFLDTLQVSSTYVGSVENPFGSGAPAGQASILATASPLPGCSVGSQASAWFELR